MTDYDGDQTIGNMTLDEAAENDAEMVADAIRNADRYFFKNSQKAQMFVAYCLSRTLESLGFESPERIHSQKKQFDRWLKKKGVKIEPRTHYEGEDDWRNGLYVYHRDILVAFISKVMPFKRYPYLVNGSVDEWIVVTNAKLK